MHMIAQESFFFLTLICNTRCTLAPTTRRVQQIVTDCNTLLLVRHDSQKSYLTHFGFGHVPKPNNKKYVRFFFYSTNARESSLTSTHTVAQGICL